MQCEVTMTGDGTPPLALVEGAPHTRKLIKAVASYAAAMADLAEAKDVAAAKANVDAAEKSIETLFTISAWVRRQPVSPRRSPQLPRPDDTGTPQCFARGCARS
jgi:hypothetical protein